MKKLKPQKFCDLSKVKKVIVADGGLKLKSDFKVKV